MHAAALYEPISAYREKDKIFREALLTLEYFPKQDSPFLPLFDHYLRLLLERGTINQIIQRYVTTEKPACSDTSGEPIGFDNCFTAFLVLLLGLAAGMVSLAVEVMDGNRFCLAKLHDECLLEDEEKRGSLSSESAVGAWQWRLLRSTAKRVDALESEEEYLRKELATLRKRHGH